MLIEKIHEEIGHFGEMRTLVEVKKRFFWHDKIEFIKKFIKTCEKCQLAKQSGNMRSSIEEMKSIPICNLFYCVAMDTFGPLPETINGNKYVLVAIDHYSKWCEARPIKEPNACTVVKFLEDEIICEYGVPKYILTNNGSEWMKEFAEICSNYGITHQFTAPF
jgi:transposase InsO family protein